MTTNRLRVLAVSTLAVASLAAAGCGGSEEDKVEEAVKDGAAAAKDKDAGKFCDLVSEESLEQLEDGAGKECEQAFDEQALDALAEDAPDPDSIEFDKVTVDGEKATVKIKGEEEETQLVKEDGDWKVEG